MSTIFPTVEWTLTMIPTLAHPSAAYSACMCFKDVRSTHINDLRSYIFGSEHVVVNSGLRKDSWNWRLSYWRVIASPSHYLFHFSHRTPCAPQQVVPSDGLPASRLSLRGRCKKARAGYRTRLFKYFLFVHGIWIWRSCLGRTFVYIISLSSSLLALDHTPHSYSSTILTLEAARVQCTPIIRLYAR